MSMKYGSSHRKKGMIFAWFKANQRWDQKKPAYPIQRSLFLMNTSNETVHVNLKVMFYRMGIATKRIKIKNKEYPIGSPYPIIDSPLTIDEIRINFGKTNTDVFTEGFNPKKTFSELRYAQTIIDEYGNKGYEFNIKLEPTGHEEITLGPFYWLPLVHEIGLLISPYIRVHEKESYHVLEDNLVYVLSSPDTEYEKRLQVHHEMQETENMDSLEHRTIWIKRSFEENYLWYFVDLTPQLKGIYLRHKFEFHVDDIIQAQFTENLQKLSTEAKHGKHYLQQLLALIQTYLIGVNDSSLQELLEEYQTITKEDQNLDPLQQNPKTKLNDVLMEELYHIGSLEQDDQQPNPSPSRLPEDMDLNEALGFELEALNELYDDKLFDDVSIKGESENPFYLFLKKYAFTMYFLFLIIRTHRKFHEQAVPIQAVLWSLYLKHKIPFEVIQAWQSILQLTQELDSFFPSTTLHYSKTFELDWVPELFVNALLYHINEGKEAIKILNKQVSFETDSTGNFTEQLPRIPQSIAWTTDDTQAAIELVTSFLDNLYLFFEGTKQLTVITQITDDELVFHEFDDHLFLKEASNKQKQQFLDLLTQISFMESSDLAFPHQQVKNQQHDPIHITELKNVLQESEYHELFVYDEFLVNLHHAIAMSFITLDGRYINQVSMNLSSMFIEKLISLYYPITFFEGVTLQDILQSLKQLLDNISQLTPENIHQFPIASFIKLFEIFSFYSDKTYALSKDPIIFSRPVSIDGVKKYYKDLQFFVPKIIARQAHVILYMLFMLLESLETKKQGTSSIKTGEDLINLIRTFEALPHLLGRSNENLNALYEVLKEIGIEEPTDIYVDESIELETQFGVPFNPDIGELIQDKELSLEQALLLTSKALLSRSRFFKRQKKLTKEHVQYILNTFNKYNFEQKLLRELKLILPYIQDDYRNAIARLQVKLIQELKVQTTQTLATWDLIQDIRSFIYQGQDFSAYKNQQDNMINDLTNSTAYLLQPIMPRFSDLPVHDLAKTIKDLLAFIKKTKELVSFGPWEAPHDLIHIVLYRILQYFSAIGEALMFHSELHETNKTILHEKDIKHLIQIHKLVLEILEYMDFSWFTEDIEKYLQISITEFNMIKNNYMVYDKIHVIDHSIGSHLILSAKIMYAYMREYLLSEGKSVLLLLNEMYLNAEQLHVDLDNLQKQKKLDRLFHEIFSLETTSLLTKKALDVKIRATLRLLIHNEHGKARILQQARKILTLFNQGHALYLQQLYEKSL